MVEGVGNLDGTDIAHGERLLAQRSGVWKLAVSLWVVVVGAGFVFFSVFGWALGALIARSRRMWGLTGLWFALYVVAIVAIETWSDGTDLGVLVFIVIWISSVAHAAYLSRAVLRARAVASARAAGWRPPERPATGTPQAPPAPPQPEMPTIPLPDGVAPQRRDLRDS